MRAKQHTLIGATAIAALAAGASAQVGGEIVNIEAALHGDWNLLTTPVFIPGSQGGHFGLDTLLVQESAPQFVPGTVPIEAERWADLWIKVHRVPDSNEPAMISIDKDVFNNTLTHWTDFHMELGLGIGGQFEPFDGLEFKTDPPPLEEAGVFPNPPMSMTPHDLWWLADGEFTGVPAPLNGTVFSARFWLGVNVPDSLFQPDPITGVETAMFTLRQHWTPSPNAAGTFAIAGLAALRRRRRA